MRSLPLQAVSGSRMFCIRSARLLSQNQSSLFVFYFFDNLFLLFLSFSMFCPVLFLIASAFFFGGALFHSMDVSSAIDSPNCSAFPPLLSLLATFFFGLNDFPPIDSLFPRRGWSPEVLLSSSKTCALVLSYFLFFFSPGARSFFDVFLSFTFLTSEKPLFSSPPQFFPPEFYFTLSSVFVAV